MSFYVVVNATMGEERAIHSFGSGIRNLRGKCEQSLQLHRSGPGASFKGEWKPCRIEVGYTSRNVQVDALDSYAKERILYCSDGQVINVPIISP